MTEKANVWQVHKYLNANACQLSSEDNMMAWNQSNKLGHGDGQNYQEQIYDFSSENPLKGCSSTFFLFLTVET